ncbi:hypothetical protein [Streptomyces atratus]|uniref:hypothetical protein n=1 Tax=Streptomyces atratus TaxID=1893 RepID=UPI0016704D8F|nr:hypothetical protein [Streptomyces atratus]
MGNHALVRPRHHLGPPGHHHPQLHHLDTFTEGEPGPVVREIAGGPWMCFLIPPGSSKEYDWPPGARCFGPAARWPVRGHPRPRRQHVPLSWRYGAPRKGEFVDMELL